MKDEPLPYTVTLDYSEWLNILDALDEKADDLAFRDHPEMAEEARLIRKKISKVIDAPA